MTKNIARPLEKTIQGALLAQLDELKVSLILVSLSCQLTVVILREISLAT